MAALEICTGRLVLGPLLTGDVDALFAYRSDASVGRYQGGVPATLAEAVRFIEGLDGVGFDTPGTWFQLGIRAVGCEGLIGDLGLGFSNGDGRQVELGITLAPHAQGNGYATEALGAILQQLLGELGKHRVFASVDPRNGASIRLLRRVGMRQEAHFKQSLWLRGE